MPTHTLTFGIQAGGKTLGSQFSRTSESATTLREVVANASTDEEIAVAIDVSAVKSFFIVSDVNVTVETNDGTTPDNTLALKAGVPYVWFTDAYDSFLLTDDVTAIFVTNASGGSATIQLEVLQDPTP